VYICRPICLRKKNRLRTPIDNSEASVKSTDWRSFFLTNSSAIHANRM